MKSFEKTIKYVATAVAALLAVAIVVCILNFILFFFVGANDKLTDYSTTFSVKDIKSITLENTSSNVNITTTTGSDIVIKAENVSASFKCTTNSKGILRINNSGSKHSFLSFRKKKHGKINLYVPEDFKLNMLNLDCGIGDVEIQNLSVKKFEIDGGVGDTKLFSCNIENGEFDIGVGDIKLDDCVLYDADIDGGIGNIDININGNIDAYSFNIDSGIGNVRINDEKPSAYADNKGIHKIKCDSGVGDIKITIE